MITIRYADLPEGLHAQAERRGRRTVIYLRPGLTAEQRRLGLRRARQSARMGYGPRLPAAGVAQAIARDSIRGTLGTMGAVLRKHPIGSMLLAAGFVTMVSCYALFVTGSIRLVLHTSPGPLGGPHPAVAPPVPGPSQSETRVPGTPGSSARSPAPASRRRATPSPDASPGQPSPARSGGASPTPARSQSAAPPPAPSPSPSELCLNVGPLGVCVP